MNLRARDLTQSLEQFDKDYFAFVDSMNEFSKCHNSSVSTVLYAEDGRRLAALADCKKKLQEAQHALDRTIDSIEHATQEMKDYYAALKHLEREYY